MREKHHQNIPYANLKNKNLSTSGYLGLISYTLDHMKRCLCCQRNIPDCSWTNQRPTCHPHESSEVESFYKGTEHGVEKRSSQLPVRKVHRFYGESTGRKLLFIDVGFRQSASNHSSTHPVCVVNAL